MAKNAMFTQQELSEFDNRVAHIHADGRSRQDDPADAMDFDAWLNSPEGIA